MDLLFGLRPSIPSDGSLHDAAISSLFLAVPISHIAFVWTLTGIAAHRANRLSRKKAVRLVASASAAYGLCVYAVFMALK